MTKRMLIDATHAEETRVVVLDGTRLEDFDVETSTKKQLKGNIYLAKVVRVEPSLQAAFVEYGGGRHGFLAFGEIHPDYYQIPVADRQRLLALQAEEAREEAEAEDAAAAADTGEAPPRVEPRQSTLDAEADEQPAEPLEPPAAEEMAAPAGETEAPELVALAELAEAPVAEAPVTSESDPVAAEAPEPEPGMAAAPEPTIAETSEAPDDAPRPAQAMTLHREERFGRDDEGEQSDLDAPVPDLLPPETIGGETETADAAEEARARRTSRFLRNYRIQEVIRRRQILLVQVVKEERGTKGAALTTYISLAGRFCVLMPNSPRGGGISRKITSAADRRRLKEITAELDIPTGMGLIVRTAGANRPKPEIKRDCEYLMRLWDDIREHTLRSVAPALIYEEASLIKRTIRDVYSRDIDEVLVDGAEGWKAAHDFMRMLMPSHAKKVILWRGDGSGAPGAANQPLFAKYQVEAQLDGMLAPTVQLKSGGYLVIGQTEALVAIDVNSGRSTRERGIEETALRTNLEAADEVARQLRLRDLAGLIVIDFIDMDARKHNAMVERRIKDALKADRARIQVGQISHFGLLEMSRQRLRPSLAETSFVMCPHCGGMGHVRSTESAAIHVLRALEEEGAKARAALIMVHVAGGVGMYLLNNKRERLAEIEARYAMRVHFNADDTLVPPAIRIDRLKPQVPESERPPAAFASAAILPPPPIDDDVEDEADDVVMTETEAAPVVAAPAAPRAEPRATAEETERKRRRRRRRRNGRREPGGDAAVAGAPAGGESDDGDDEEGEGEEAITTDIAVEATEAVASPVAEDGLAEPLADPALAEQPSLDAADLDENGLPKARRRGRRGGRRRRVGELAGDEVAVAPPVPVYVGPTPADPFGGGPFDIFDMLDEEAPPPPRAAPVAVTPPPQASEPAPAEAEAVAPAVHPVTVEAAALEPAPPVEAQAEPAAQPEPVAQAEPAAEAAPPPAEPAPPPAEPVVGPVIQPVVIGAADVAPAEPKRGWWKR